LTRDERIMAYADGELDAAACTAFELEMRYDPTLVAAVESQRALRVRVAEAYASVMQEPVPARLNAAASRGNDMVLGFSGARKPPGLPTWAALAASLAIGVFAGRALPERGPLKTNGDGTLIAQGRLAGALDRQLSGEPGAVKIGLSFRSQGGRFCRTFQSDADQVAGVACRGPAGWSANLVVRGAGAAGGPEYRMAASEAPASVMAAVDQMIAGDALDRDGEVAARAKAWRD
jgi:hypothetical protein